MRVACPLYKPLAVLAVGNAQLDFLSFSSVLELSKQYSKGAVMALAITAYMTL